MRNYPTVTLAGLTAEQKRDHALLLNLLRRTVSRRQRRGLIAAELRRSPGLSDRLLAERLGTTGRTVASVRRELTTGAEIPHPPVVRGRDGKVYRRRLAADVPAAPPAASAVGNDRTAPTRGRVTRVYADRARQADRLRAALADLGPDAPRGAVSPTNLKRAAARKRRADAAARPPAPPPGGAADADCLLIRADFRDLLAAAGLAPGSVDLVLTDPPYAAAFTPHLADLAAFAAAALRPGGVFAASLGVTQLADALAAFSGPLTYRAVAFSDCPGPAPVLHRVGCLARATPLVVCSNGPWAPPNRWCNAFRNAAPEKDVHPWQKPLAEIEHWLRTFSAPGDLVCDPLCGGGTTAVACRRAGRRFVGGDRDPAALAAARDRLAGPIAPPANRSV